VARGKLPRSVGKGTLRTHRLNGYSRSFPQPTRNTAMLSAIVLVMLAGPAAAQQVPSAPPTFDEAVQLAAAGRDAEALAAFRARAAANPNDHSARVWIGRLHERMGHPDLAEPVYRSVLLEDLSNLDAMLGVASTLLARHESKEAIQILDAAARMAPQNAAVFTLLGRAHRLAGEDARAIQDFERAVAIDPADDYRRRLENARLAYLHRIETRGFNEQFNGATPDSRNGYVSLNYRVTETLRVFGRGEAQRKFGTSDQRGGGGFEWRWTSSTTLRGQALVGPGNLVMPEGDYLGEIVYTHGAAVSSFGVRYFDFTGARTTVVSPAIAWMGDRSIFGFRYAASSSEATSLGGTDFGQSAQLRGDYRIYRRLWLRAGYSAGPEDFENFSIDQIGDFRANTLLAGLRVELPTLTSVVGSYEHQWRDGNVTMGRVTVGLQQRF
jgi:YaiO family outer membrane protein